MSEFTMSDVVQGYWRADEWQLAPTQLLSFLRQHIDLGVTTTDHADIYGDYRCEQLFGQALKLDRSVRHKIQLVTKCGIKLVSAQNYPFRKINHYDSSYAHIIYSVEQSLQKLATDYIDLLLIHRPDYLMQADEVARAFSDLKSQGKVLHFGVSNFSEAQFNLLSQVADVELQTNQIEINPFNLSIFDSGILETLARLKLRPMAWSPLGGGRLFTDPSEQAGRIRDELTAIGDELGGTDADQVVYAWIYSLPVRPAVIVGSGKIERVAAAQQASKYRLSREQWYRIWRASIGHDVP